jgi:hypothetical protein
MGQEVVRKVVTERNFLRPDRMSDAWLETEETGSRVTRGKAEKGVKEDEEEMIFLKGFHE